MKKNAVFFLWYVIYETNLSLIGNTSYYTSPLQLLVLLVELFQVLIPHMVMELFEAEVPLQNIGQHYLYIIMMVLPTLSY